MMPHPTEGPDSQSGFTLVELLVVMVILAVIGSLVAASITSGLRADARARSRIEAFENMQIATERMTREIRGANLPLLVADSDEIQFDVLREDVCHRFTYELVGQDLQVSEARFESDCSTATGSSGPFVLVSDLDLTANDEIDALFTYWPADRSSTIAPGDPDNPNLAAVEIALVHELALDQRPVTVTTLVGLRNF